MNRFCRIEQLLGKASLEKLQAARVAVFGLGAVGSYAVEALARAGVGYLRLVDCDVVRLSNFNRQLYALESTLNRPKAEVARARVLDINPACTVEAHQAFVDGSTAQALLAQPLDVVVDAIDSVAPKVMLIATAVMPCTKSKMLSGGRPSSTSTASMILAVSPFEKPRRRRKSLRSSSVRATMRSRATLMPLMKGMGDELAKFSSAGAASWAKREAAYLLWRMLISSKSSTPHRFRFWHTARR